MADTPLIWEVGESILINLIVTDPNTGLPLTGQTPYLNLTIQRSSDGWYWTASGWVVPLSFVLFTEVDPINEPGRYIYVLPSGANLIVDRYTIHSSINNSPTIVGDTYEVHVSRITSVNVYDIVPSDP